MPYLFSMDVQRGYTLCSFSNHLEYGFIFNGRGVDFLPLGVRHFGQGATLLGVDLLAFYVAFYPGDYYNKSNACFRASDLLKCHVLRSFLNAPTTFFLLAGITLTVASLKHMRLFLNNSNRLWRMLNRKVVYIFKWKLATNQCTNFFINYQ